MRSQGPLNAEIVAEIAFHDVDLAHVTWHGHYLKFLENARWALMDLVGYGLGEILAAEQSWPIVDLQVKYVRATRFRDRLRVRASLVEWTSRLVVHYLATDAANGERVMRARTTQVVVDNRSGLLQYELPQQFVTRVESAIGRNSGTGA